VPLGAACQPVIASRSCQGHDLGSLALRGNFVSYMHAEVP
jgi:hypothetical protein